MPIQSIAALVMLLVLLGGGVFVTSVKDGSRGNAEQRQGESIAVETNESTTASTTPNEAKSNSVDNTTTDEPVVTQTKEEKEVVLVEDTTPKGVNTDTSNKDIDYSTYSNFIRQEDLETLNEEDYKGFDLTPIVLVRCVFKTQYYSLSASKEDELTFTLGTGFFINPDGTILTAGHVVRKETLGTDKSGRVWNRDKCQIARGQGGRHEVKSADTRYWGAEPWFEDINIIYQAPEDLYRDGKGLDFALLKLKEKNNNNPYYTLTPKMVILEKDKYGPVAVGYPSRDISITQQTERADGVFTQILSLDKEVCRGVDYTTPCGWRYELYRDAKDSVIKGTTFSFGNYYSYLGQSASSVRGGFSGSPVFMKGNVIGILTTSSANEEGKYKGKDFFYALTSYDIVEALKSEGISY
ncbi:hypothetical protein A3D62_01625 [Candidatus Kaiserbacteria bacterium RIFCSPHIGHO2_02_FULL_49_11]|uniref:Serine protease n=1 Tax=Candidatus Kaiserbacteria bacterium RIFCSPHIGHO2_02_FULL_49_11 TaxID=1798489 RepID=A0A1F6D1J5_9BACT|nr:MAG: hypothetical protein A3D62_01625 [Candidatus Kaiserbacteria bacterium RIFCSPHIGHO2_02_FULL_49_11]